MFGSVILLEPRPNSYRLFQMNWSDTSSLTKLFKRASFILSRSSYADLLSIVKRANEDLESLTNANIELEPKRRIRSRLRLLSISREMSLSIYRAIRSSLACKCDHTVKLRLSTYTSNNIPSDGEEDITRDLRFHLALSLLGKSSGWKEVLIKAGPLQPLPVIQPALPRSTPSSTPRITTKNWKKLSFAASYSSSKSDTLTQVEISQISSPTSRAKTTTLFDVGSTTDLCEVLRAASKQRGTDRYGVIFDPLPGKKKSYDVCPTPWLGGGDQDTCRMVSLHDALEGGNGLPHLAYRDRLELAVFIASSTLQLYKTPWLPEIISSRDIFLIQRGALRLYGHAFVMADRDAPAKNASAIHAIRNPTLLTLGILLVELIQGQTMESLSTKNSAVVVYPDLLEEYSAAKRMLKEIDQASSNYGSAVRRCLDGEFDREDLNLDNEDFRHEVYCGVVALLEEDLRYSYRNGVGGI